MQNKADRPTSGSDDQDYEPVHRGRLFKLRLERSLAAREDALASIRQVPPLGHWQARIGGRVRGRTVTFLSYNEARTAVHDYYNRKLYDHVARKEAE